MEKITNFNEQQLAILTDALAKSKEQFDKVLQANDGNGVYDSVSQMVRLSHSITEAVKAANESRLETLVRECTEAVDDLAEDLADLSLELICGNDDVAF